MISNNARIYDEEVAIISHRRGRRHRFTLEETRMAYEHIIVLYYRLPDCTARFVQSTNYVQLYVYICNIKCYLQFIYVYSVNVHRIRRDQTFVAAGRGSLKPLLKPLFVYIIQYTFACYNSSWSILVDCHSIQHACNIIIHTVSTWAKFILKLYNERLNSQEAVFKV